MTEEIIIAGFGGQGILSMGKIICYSAIMQDFEVSWMPSYGPEMRGGTANVTVILSQGPISSPVLNEFDTAILLNQQSIDKFEPTVKSGGLLIYDKAAISKHPERTDLRIFSLDATAAANSLGSLRTHNMIMLGAYLKVKNIIDIDNIRKGMEKSLHERYHKLIPLNMEGIKKGMELITL